MDPEQGRTETESAKTPTADKELAVHHAGIPMFENRVKIECARKMKSNDQLSMECQDTLVAVADPPNAKSNRHTAHCIRCTSEAGRETCAAYNVNKENVAFDGVVASYEKARDPVAGNKESFYLQEESGCIRCPRSATHNKDCPGLHEDSGHIERHGPGSRNKECPDLHQSSSDVLRRPVAHNKQSPDLHETSDQIEYRLPAAGRNRCPDLRKGFDHTECHRQPLPTSTTVSTSVLALLGHNILQVFVKVAWIMQWPFALLICVFACISMYNATWRMGSELLSGSLQPVCQLPGFHVLPTCRTARITVTRQVYPFADKVDSRAADIAKIQAYAVDHVTQPRNLLQGQSGMRSLILGLAGLDLPNKNTLLTLLEDLKRLAEESIDTMETSLIKTKSLVDNTMISNAWARNKLSLIEARSHSALAPLYSIAETIGLSRDTSAQDVEATFMQYNDMLYDQAGEVLSHFQQSHKTLKELRDLIEKLSMALGEEHRGLEHQRLSEASYWKELLGPHAAKMRNIEKLTTACAKFSKDLDQAHEVVETTSRELIKVRARVQSFQDQLKVASLDKRRAGKDAERLELTIKRLSASIKYLADAKQAARARERKLERLDNYGPGM